MRGLFVIVVAFSTYACGGAEPTTTYTVKRTPPGDARARALWHRYESKLLSAEVIEMTARIEATGAWAANMFVKAKLGAGNRVFFQVTGTLYGKPINLAYPGDGRVGGPTANRALREWFVIGFARVGLIHNVLALSLSRSSNGDDWGDLAVKRRARVDNLDFAPPRTSPAADESELTFAVWFDGKRSSDAKVSIETPSLRPLWRHETMYFPLGAAGEVKIKETYQMAYGSSPAATPGSIR